MGGWQGRMLVNLVVGLQGVGGAGLELRIRRAGVRMEGLGDELGADERVEEEVSSVVFCCSSSL